MKRKLGCTILFTLLSIYSLVSQTYKISYSIPYNEGRNNYCSDYYVSVKFEGETNFIEIGGGGWAGGRNTLTGSLDDINVSRKIDQFKFYAKRHSGRWCWDSSRNSRTYTVDTYHQSCGDYNIDVSYLGEALGGVSNAKITIEPNNVRITHNDDSSIYATKTLCETKSAGVSATSGFSSVIFKWEFLDPVNTITKRTSAYQTLYDRYLDYYEDYVNCLNSGGDGDTPYALKTTNKVVATKEKSVKEQDADIVARPIIPIDGGGACDYFYTRYNTAWIAYRDYSGTKYYEDKLWRPLNKNYQRSISLRLSDFYASEADRKEALNNKVIWVRLNPGCNGDANVSNVIKLQFLPEPPEIAKAPTATSPSCSYDEIGNFTLYFMRQLYSHEKLEVNLQKKFQDGTYVPVEDNVGITTLTRVNDTEYKHLWVSGGEVLTGGDYRMIVSGFDKSNSSPFCEDYTYDFTITVPPPVIFESATNELDETCFGANNGKIKINASGGTGTFKYSLNNGTTWSSSTFSGEIIATTGPGSYTVKVKDTNDCIDQDNESRSVTINAASLITHVLGTPINVSAIGQSDGEIIISSISGGTITDGSYDYTIKNASGSDLTSGTIPASGGTISGLPIGTHKIVYKDDSDNCEREYILPQISNPIPIDFVLSSEKPDCNGGFGKLTVSNISGGYPNYKVTINQTDGSYSSITDNLAGSTTHEFENIPVGSYEVIVKDSRLNAQIEKTITVQEQSEITITNIDNTTIACYGYSSQVTITATGGKSEAYQYAIYKATNIQWQDSNVFSLAASPTTGYRFIVRDKNSTDCKSSISNVLRISEPSEIDIIGQPTVTNNTIFGASNGTIQINITGGTPNYTVTWQKQGDTSFSKTGSSITGLSAGFYIATISDQASPICTYISDPIEVKENPELIINSLNITTDIVCYGDLGSLSVNVQGGSNAYNYKWYRNNILIVGQTANTLVDVDFATYKVEVFDGYVLREAMETFANPTRVEADIEKTDITCFGKEDGTIKINPRGGSGTYLYSIDDKTTYTALNTLANNTITDLVEGEYEVWLKDDKGCEIETSLKTTITSPTEIKITSFTVINCNVIGAAEGSIAIEVSGGEGDFTYSWTKEGEVTFSSISKDIAALTAGFYIVEILDERGCLISERYEVKEPLPLEVAVQQTNEIKCFGDETGSLLAEVKGGFPIDANILDFDYQWYSVEESGTFLLNTDLKLNEISNLKAGEYKVVITDAKGTTVTSAIFEISQPLVLTIVEASKQNVSCHLGNDGKIAVNITGGTEAYTFTWTKDSTSSFVENTQDISDLSKGFYNLTVEDANGCTTSLTSIEITEPIQELNVASYEEINLTGFEEGDGSISVEVQGGTPEYTYEWRVKDGTISIGSEEVIENLQIGDYEVIITDANDCQIIEYYSLTQPDLLAITSITQSSEVLCFGDQEITLSAVVEGGVEPYQYNWFIKENTELLTDTSTLTNVGSGIYVLEITDANQIKTTKEYEILEPTKLEVASLNVENVSCFNGSDGSILIEAIGGVAPYTYSWKHGTETTNNLSDLSSGTYTVTIRDQNLCFIEEVIEIQQPNKGLTVVDEVVENVTGNGLSNGSVTIEIEGGTPEYTYEWVYEGNVLEEETTNSISNKIAGAYTLKVSDSKLCELVLEYTITEPLELKATINETAILCNGDNGKLSAVIEGGVAPYSYNWYNNAGDLISSEEELLVVSGTYSFEVVDANNNKNKIEEINLEQPLALEINTVNITNVTCYNGSDGAIEVIVSGGTGNVNDYTYSWSNGKSGNILENTTAGSYTLTITDENGCILEREGIIISEPEPFKIIETKLVRPSYEETTDGSIQITITGGEPSYTYEWKDENGEIVSTITTTEKVNSIENLKQGTYSITITDGISCSIEETYNLANPGELLVSIEQLQEITCFNGSDATLDVITVGGVGGNNYQWFNLNDDINVLSTKKQLTNVPAGSYYVVVSNAEGVEEKSSIFQINQPTDISLSATINNPSCFELNNGSITFNVSGGSENYEYRYRFSIDSFSEWIGINNQQATIGDLIAGQYGIQVRGVVGDYYCLATDYEDLDNEFTFTLNQPSLLEISSEVIENTTGFGLSNGSINIQVEGGTAPYQYYWENSDGMLISSENESIENLKAGIYSVIVVDAQACDTSALFTIEQPEPLTASIEINTLVSCQGQQDGALIVSVSGGISGYSYAWFNEELTEVLGTENKLSNIGVGTYYVEIEDSKGNTLKSDVFTIEEPETLQLELSSDYDLCGIGEDWTINSQVVGGTAPYSYLWSTGEYSASISELVLGDYELTVVDARGCTQSITISLQAPEELKINDFTLINPTCFNGNDGEIELFITGGAAPYEYEWSNNTTSKIANQLSAGNYLVKVTDSKGCSTIKSFDITNPDEIVVDLGEDVTLCKDQSYVIDATIATGVSYSWTANNGFTSSKAVVELAKEGIYTVEIVTDLGCIVSDSIEIKISDKDLDAEFIVSSVVYTNETVVMINISDYTFDEVTWFFPENATIIYEGPEYAEILIEEEGDYEISVKTRLGDCEKIKTKNLLVLEREFNEEDDLTEDDKQLLESVELYPNPSSGFFNLDISLKEEKTVNVKIYKLNSTVIHYQNYYDNNFYELDYNFSLPTGVYFVLVETEKDRMLKKLIIE